RPTRNGASIITRTILVMTAASAAGSLIARPAATTWATSCTVAPVNTPKAVSSSGIQPALVPHRYSSGYRNIASVPNTTTVATATATCSARPLTTGSAAITAAAPQIELPAPINRVVLRSSPNTRVPSHHARAKVEHSTSASIITPVTPT